jgi:hypothetical protein
MRVTMALPLAAAFVLAACGSSSSSDANGDGKISTQEAASAAAKMDAPRPGKYKTTVNLLDFTMPGMPAAMLERLKGSMTSNMTTTFCQTGDNRKQAIKDMTDAMGRGNCTYNSLDISGNNFDVDMSCTSPQGGTGHYKVNGTVSSEGTDMTMEITQDMPQGGGQMHMKTHAVSTRIGDCTS